eukprot:CAMPEP_0172726866 /NCGR_PEP_ID=MMETSP1074-20121228/91356_1 /TAXON_ID=2916 /ORGANISM="Ceratium fusus, Strain PA161109" /LENGTH=178 /DNA_ID=CAMNT_0013553965 /DNA_START=123 /DNA_END=659 /DNA_ORIENTATION=+
MALALVSRDEAWQRTISAWASRNPQLVRRSHLGTLGYASACFLWHALGTCVGTSAATEAQRDTTLALVTAGLAQLLRCCLAIIDDLQRFRNTHAASKVAESEARTVLATVRDEGAEAAAEAERWKMAAKNLELQVAAIRKQAESQAQEYMRLISENKSLQNQLSDFDIVFGDSRKKQT